MTKKLIPLIVIAAVVVVILGAFTIMGWDNIALDLKYQYLDDLNEATNESSVSWYIGRSPDVTIPEKIYDVKIVKIGSNFGKARKEKIESVTMNDNIVEIGSKAFSWDNTSLKKITLSNKLTEIGSEAFSGCKSLESISIPAGVTSIKDNTFANCTALKTVTLPDGITNISASAFTNCTNVNITYKGQTYTYDQIDALIAAAA